MVRIGGGGVEGRGVAEEDEERIEGWRRRGGERGRWREEDFAGGEREEN